MPACLLACSMAISKQLDTQAPLNTLSDVTEWHGDIAGRPPLTRGDLFENRPVGCLVECKGSPTTSESGRCWYPFGLGLSLPSDCPECRRAPAFCAAFLP